MERKFHCCGARTSVVLAPKNLARCSRAATWQKRRLACGGLRENVPQLRTQLTPFRSRCAAIDRSSVAFSGSVPTMMAELVKCMRRSTDES